MRPWRRGPATTAAPSRGASRPGSGRVLDGVLQDAEAFGPALVDVGDDADDRARRTARRRCGAPARRARGAAPPVRACRARDGRATDVAPGPSTACSTAASLIGIGWRSGYRLRRESCPPVFAHGLQPLGGHDADLRLRRPDRRARSARHLRRAARLRPVRGPQRAALRPARLGGDAARSPTRRPRDRAATTCWRSPTRSARRPARCRRRPDPCRRRPAARCTRRGHLRVLTSD